MNELFDKFPRLFMWATSLAAFANPRILLLEDGIQDALPGAVEK
jgi:hypothetical protein